jgi:hypothetical protein
MLPGQGKPEILRIDRFRPRRRNGKEAPAKKNRGEVVKAAIGQRCHMEKYSRERAFASVRCRRYVLKGVLFAPVHLIFPSIHLSKRSSHLKGAPEHAPVFPALKNTA